MGPASGIGQRRAFDLHFNAFGNAPQDSVETVLRFHKAEEPQVFLFLLAPHSDLDEAVPRSLLV
jgi:hypothetical protein